MNLITLLQAAPAASSPAGGGGLNFILMMVLLFGVMYFFMIRPQQKKQKELAKFRDALKKGDKIVTIGGIYGTIREIKDNYVLVDVDTNTTIRFDKSAINRDPSDIQQPAK